MADINIGPLLTARQATQILDPGFDAMDLARAQERGIEGQERRAQELQPFLVQQAQQREEQARRTAAIQQEESARKAQVLQAQNQFMAQIKEPMNALPFMKKLQKSVSDPNANRETVLKSIDVQIRQAQKIGNLEAVNTLMALRRQPTEEIRADINSIDTVERSIAEQSRRLGIPSIGKDFTLAPGQIRFSPCGSIIAEGGGDPNQRAKDLNAQVKLNNSIFEKEKTIRNEIFKNTAEFRKSVNAFDRIQSSMRESSAAGDIALIFNFMKMLDPGSVVREGEFATAQNAAGVPDRVRNIFNKLIDGERLNPKQRLDFFNQSKNIFDSAKIRNDQTVEGFLRIADNNNLSRENIFVEQGAPLSGQPVEGSVQALSDEDLLLQFEAARRGR